VAHEVLSQQLRAAVRPDLGRKSRHPARRTVASPQTWPWSRLS
jgi:hypothetical protein